MQGTTRNWRRWVFAFAAFACVQFVVLTVLAMFCYPGGTRVDPTTAGYLFFYNFFSDLGLTVAHCAISNTVSLLLFFTALSLSGVALVLFFVAIPHLFAGTRAGRWLSRIGSAIGVVSGISYIGIAATPGDVNMAAHIAFVYAAFTLFLPVAILYAVAIFKSEGYPNRFAYTFLAYAVVLTGYLLLMFLGPRSATPEGLMIQATGQKAVVYAFIICMFIQSLGAWRMTKKTEEVLV